MTPWTAAYQAPPSMGFARQEYWSGKYAAGRQQKKKKGKKESAAAQERERRERLDQLFQTWKMEVARECRQPLKIGKTRDNFSPRASRRNVVLPTP